MVRKTSGLIVELAANMGFSEEVQRLADTVLAFRSASDHKFVHAFVDGEPSLGIERKNAQERQAGAEIKDTPEETQKKIRLIKEDNVRQIKKDGPRYKLADFTQTRSFFVSECEVFFAKSEETYSQGDLEAGAQKLLHDQLKRLKMQEMEDAGVSPEDIEEYLSSFKEMRVIYRDDNGKLSSFSLLYNEKASSSWSLQIDRNILSPFAERPTALFDQGMFHPSPFLQDGTGIALSNDAWPVQIREALGSQPVSQLLSGVFNALGECDLKAVEELHRRVYQGPNIDNRDNRREMFKALIRSVGEIYKEKIQDLNSLLQASEQEMDFFRDHRFEFTIRQIIQTLPNHEIPRDKFSHALALDNTLLRLSNELPSVLTEAQNYHAVVMRSFSQTEEKDEEPSELLTKLDLGYELLVLKRSLGDLRNRDLISELKGMQDHYQIMDERVKIAFSACFQRIEAGKGQCHKEEKEALDELAPLPEDKGFVQRNSKDIGLSTLTFLVWLSLTLILTALQFLILSVIAVFISFSIVAHIRKNEENYSLEHNAAIAERNQLTHCIDNDAEQRFEPHQGLDRANPEMDDNFKQQYYRTRIKESRLRLAVNTKQAVEILIHDFLACFVKRSELALVEAGREDDSASDHFHVLSDTDSTSDSLPTLGRGGPTPESERSLSQSSEESKPDGDEMDTIIAGSSDSTPERSPVFDSLTESLQVAPWRRDALSRESSPKRPFFKDLEANDTSDEAPVVVEGQEILSVHN